MKPDTILGWSLDTKGRSHLVCESTVVVGTRSAADATVLFLLCGTTSETMHGVADEANRPMCSKCIACAFKLAKLDSLPDMETRKVVGGR